MKKLSLILCFFVCTSMVSREGLPLERLIDIQMELSYLLNKKVLLENEISHHQHNDVNEEIGSMGKMLDFHWGEFVSKLKNAKIYERMAHEEQTELNAIDRQIDHLSLEIQALLNHSK